MDRERCTAERLGKATHKILNHMQELLEYLTQEITGNSQIKVQQTDSGDLQIYTITAPKEVMGILIGKDGKTIRAIRSLARARAIVDQIKVAVKLEESA